MVEIKKLVTREEHEKKRKRNYIIIAVMVVFLMVLSPAGYTMLRDDSGSGNTGQNNAEFNGIKFIKDDNGYWGFQKDGKTFSARYNPAELNDTKSSVVLFLNNYQDQVLSFEWNETQDGVYELRRNLEGNSIPLRVVSKACLSNCSGDYPLKNCDDDKVISFRIPDKGEKERVYKENNCVFIVANETNQVKYADAFLYNLLGIK